MDRARVHARALERRLSRDGHTVRVIEDGGAAGLERRYTGEEDGFKAIKAIFESERLPVPHGLLEALRGEADEARADHRDLRMTVSHASLEFTPTLNTRVVDDTTTYAVIFVEKQYVGESVIGYTLSVSPV